MKVRITPSASKQLRRPSLLLRGLCAGLCIAMTSSLAACNGVDFLSGIGGPEVDRVSADQPYYSAKDLPGYTAEEGEDVYIVSVAEANEKVLVVLTVSKYTEGEGEPVEPLPIDIAEPVDETLAASEDAESTETDTTESSAAADETVAPDETIADDATDTTVAEDESELSEDEIKQMEASMYDEAMNGTYTSKTILLSYSKTGELLSESDMSSIVDENSSIMRISVRADGTLVALISSFDPESYEQIFNECAIDETGKIIGSPVAIDLPENFYPNDVVYDDEGNRYFSGWAETAMVYVTDASGEKIFEAMDDNINSKFFEMDGKIYVDGYNVEDNYSYVFFEIDLETKELGKPMDMGFIQSSGMNSFFAGPEGMYVQTMTGISKVDLEEKTTKEIISWSDCNFEREMYGDDRIVMLSDKQLMIFSNIYDNETMKSNIRAVLLSKEATNPDAGKIIITVGGIGVSYDNVLLKNIYEFNKTNTEYRIVTKDYEANIDYSKFEDEEDYRKFYADMISKMNLEIVSGDGPDILYSRDSSFSLYESKGLLVDLNTLIEKDETFKKDDFLPSLFTVCATGDKLYKLGTACYISGLAGTKNLIGDRTGWNFEEINEVAASLPEGMDILSPYGMTQSYILEKLLNTSMASFVDPLSGDVKFDTEEFRSLLAFSKTYGKDDDAEENWENYVDDMTLIRNGELALTEAWVGDPTSFHQLAAAFGEPISVVGFPSSAKNGPICQMNSMFAISSDSPSVDAAWSFIKTFFTEEAQTKVAENWSIPFLKVAFENQIQKAIEGDDNMQVIYYEGMPENSKMTEESAEAYRALVNSLTTMPSVDPAVQAIILEEVPAYFNDQKSVEDVSKLIQNRAETIINERK